MALGARLSPWTGEAYRHIPSSNRYDLLDFRFAGRGQDSRWNDPGVPTLYLAGDEGVLIAEWGRHFAVNRTPDLRRETVERAVYRLTVTVDNVLDLRSPTVWEELSLQDAPTCFLEIGVARATANFVRRTTAAQALLVPPMSFLDQLDRWCLVLFLEKLPADWTTFISDVTLIGALRRG